MTKGNHGADCWTGLAEVRGDAGNELLPQGLNALARLFGRATDADDFVARANEMLRQYKLDVIGFSDVQPVDPRKLYGETEERLEELVDQARKVKGPICGTFHRYPSGSQFDQLRAIFNNVDPQGIFVGDNLDEYDSEIKLILAELPLCGDIKRVKALIWKVFRSLFGDKGAGTEDDYDELSRRLFDWKSKNV